MYAWDLLRNLILSLINTYSVSHLQRRRLLAPPLQRWHQHHHHLKPPTQSPYPATNTMSVPYPVVDASQ
ncbi:hypothetical protein DAPPUDRAFT_238946 [Daphnia pulex]|uniref:Uncharacterized protein n=1 Tax=Daphnia pulex TaxID=6669 RepID=E9G7V9_DAPPU|nr:hypothetical protein DAPPUDRAFT_238946 [Daphnia pulex]|eukprot:EFX84550.1 hypothetical protein DAPPUDRAFT_238946 [Daphnia pulex]